MARGVNKAILLGRLGQDPEVRHTQSGSVVTNISIATEEVWKDKNSGEQQSKTEWHRVVFFGRVAEIAAEYLRKGSQCYVEGRITTEKWQGQDGQDRYTTKIVARELQLLGGPREGGGGSGGGAQSRGGGGQSAPASAPQSQSQSGMADDFDDDIPFALRLTTEEMA